jgi:DNA-binding NarL/FixJ family response regulator
VSKGRIGRRPAIQFSVYALFLAPITLLKRRPLESQPLGRAFDDSVAGVSPILQFGARNESMSERPTFRHLPPPVRFRASAPLKHLSELGLTDRQVQVFKLILQGKSNKAIANDLQITESTIKQHITPILRVLNVTTRVGAILEVARLGIPLDR